MSVLSVRRRLRGLLPPIRPTQAPEFFGPTDINAQSGNQQLTVGISREGTITVLRWPRPSYYNQIAHHTTHRDAPLYGAHPNEGSFLGLWVRRSDERETTWLRDWAATQRYDDDRSDVVVTDYHEPRLGLEVTVRDVVAADADVLVREVTVRRAADSPVSAASLVAYANVDPVVSKQPWSPTQDLKRRWTERSHARYHPDVDAVVVSKAGVDRSTETYQSVAVALGFDGATSAVHVGADAEHPTRRSGPQDAYEAACAGELPGNRGHVGKTTTALVHTLAFETNFEDNSKGENEAETVARASVLVTVESTVSESRRLLEATRDRSFDLLRQSKYEWFEGLLGEAPMPTTDDPTVLAVARRALVTLATNYDPASGAIVASIATRSPYAQDWPRDGAFCNHVLDRIGRSDWVRKRNRWYASLQETTGRYLLGAAVIPAGNWAMNYYGDGVEAGPIPWEIDGTAFAVWTLWDHYRHTGKVEYLREVYPAIRRAATFLAEFRDPATGLHRAAHEDDNVIHSRTIVGASTVWLALDSATRAASALGEEADHRRFRARRDELAGGIETHLWDPIEGAYSRGRSLLHRLLEHPLVPDAVQALPILPGTRGVSTLVWPVAFAEMDSPRMRRHLDHVWSVVAPSFEEPHAGERTFGMYETKALIALARAWREDTERLERVREGVRWIAHEHATPDTHVLGEAWILRDGDVRAAVSQPHTFTGLLFYHASLEAFPPASSGSPDST